MGYKEKLKAKQKTFKMLLTLPVEIIINETDTIFLLPLQFKSIFHEVSVYLLPKRNVVRGMLKMIKRRESKFKTFRKLNCL